MLCLCEKSEGLVKKRSVLRLKIEICEICNAGKAVGVCVSAWSVRRLFSDASEANDNKYLESEENSSALHCDVSLGVGRRSFR